jgi:hypothetical protein
MFPRMLKFIQRFATADWDLNWGWTFFLKISHGGYQKIRVLKKISKIHTCLCDNMHLKRVVPERRIVTWKNGSSPLKFIFFWNNWFLRHIDTKASLHFWNLCKKTDLLIPDMTQLCEKKIRPLLSHTQPNPAWTSCFSAWILDIELKKIVLCFPGPSQISPPPPL